MRKRKPPNRVQGIYDHDSGRKRVVYFKDGKQVTEYRSSAAAAEARARELTAQFNAPGSANSAPQRPTAGNSISRADWVMMLGAQAASLRDIVDPALRVQATDAMWRAYKAIRGDLEAIEATQATAAKPDLKSLSDEELKTRLGQLVKLKALTNGKAKA